MAALAAGLAAGAFLVISPRAGGPAGTPATAPEEGILSCPAYRPEAGGSAPALVSFEVLEMDSGYELEYKWKDFHERVLSIRFRVPRQTLLATEDEFGYSPEDLRAVLEEEAGRMQVEASRKIRARTRELMGQSEFGRYMTLKERGEDRLVLSYDVSPSLDQLLREAVTDIRDRVNHETVLQGLRIENALKKKRQDYLEARGMRWRKDDRIEIDYKRCIDRNLFPMREIADAMWSATGSDRPSLRLEALLSFVQSLGYEVPPDVEDGKNIGGFWVPARVLVEGRGDCDSRAVLAASIWRNDHRNLLILVKLARHVLLGISGLAETRGIAILVRSTRYELMELSPKDVKFPPGVVSAQALAELRSGRYEVESLN